VLILISLPASILGQYIGLMIHRRYVDGNKEFSSVFKILILSSISLISVYMILPQFKFLIIKFERFTFSLMHENEDYLHSHQFF